MPDDPSEEMPATVAELVRWSETLAAIARTGMGFTESLYERERYEEVLRVAAEIRATHDDGGSHEVFHTEWMSSIGSGVPGYVTPKVAVGACVSNDAGQVLLVQRSDSGIWLYPTGWADVGYSLSEVVVKEVQEETGIDCEPIQLLAVVDGLRMGFTRVPMHLMVFHCRATGGSLNAHPLETADVGWFSFDDLPWPMPGAQWWLPMAQAAFSGQRMAASFDPPRDPMWRGNHHG
jgi:ADP-ribose pyrophosphatase YjhB (NUDIX family)